MGHQGHSDSHSNHVYRPHRTTQAPHSLVSLFPGPAMHGVIAGTGPVCYSGMPKNRKFGSAGSSWIAMRSPSTPLGDPTGGGASMVPTHPGTSVQSCPSRASS